MSKGKGKSNYGKVEMFPLEDVLPLWTGTPPWLPQSEYEVVLSVQLRPTSRMIPLPIEEVEEPVDTK